jgi:hypothetical protein
MIRDLKQEGGGGCINLIPKDTKTLTFGREENLVLLVFS